MKRYIHLRYWLVIITLLAVIAFLGSIFVTMSLNLSTNVFVGTWVVLFVIMAIIHFSKKSAETAIDNFYQDLITAQQNLIYKMRTKDKKLYDGCFKRLSPEHKKMVITLVESENDRREDKNKSG